MLEQVLRAGPPLVGRELIYLRFRLGNSILLLLCFSQKLLCCVSYGYMMFRSSTQSQRLSAAYLMFGAAPIHEMLLLYASMSNSITRKHIMYKLPRRERKTIIMYIFKYCNIFVCFTIQCITRTILDNV